MYPCIGDENVRTEVYRQGQGLQPRAGHQGPHNLRWFEVTDLLPKCSIIPNNQGSKGIR